MKRKALHPADFADLDALRQRVMCFQCWYNEHAEPFRWNYTRQDMAAHMKRLKRCGWLPRANPLPRYGSTRRSTRLRCQPLTQNKTQSSLIALD